MLIENKFHKPMGDLLVLTITFFTSISFGGHSQSRHSNNCSNLFLLPAQSASNNPSRGGKSGGSTISNADSNADADHLKQLSKAISDIGNLLNPEYGDTDYTPIATPDNKNEIIAILDSLSLNDNHAISSNSNDPSLRGRLRYIHIMERNLQMLKVALSDSSSVKATADNAYRGIIKINEEFENLGGDLKNLIFNEDFELRSIDPNSGIMKMTEMEDLLNGRSEIYMEVRVRDNHDFKIGDALDKLVHILKLNIQRLEEIKELKQQNNTGDLAFNDSGVEGVQNFHSLLRANKTLDDVQQEIQNYKYKLNSVPPRQNSFRGRIIYTVYDKITLEVTEPNGELKTYIFGVGEFQVQKLAIKYNNN